MEAFKTIAQLDRQLLENEFIEKDMPLHQTPTILIVDDVPTNVQILADALRTGYKIKVANNGLSALEIAQRKPRPDLILLDVMMPEMDGLETCKRLKGNPQTKNIPVIFVTAKTEESDEEQGLNIGAVDYITKPFSLAITKARIRNHLQLKRQADLLESLSLVDALTHISNRRRFDEALDEEWKRAAREHTSIGLLMIDIDHFKEYNDHYGHGAGDICLQAVAAALDQGVSRPADLVARFGGEEFVVLLPETNLEAARHIGERLLHEIADLKLTHEFSGIQPFVTISIGSASMVPDDKNDQPSKLLDAADRMLYKAKEAGRNCVK